MISMIEPFFDFTSFKSDIVDELFVQFFNLLQLTELSH